MYCTIVQQNDRRWQKVECLFAMGPVGELMDERWWLSHKNLGSKRLGANQPPAFPQPRQSLYSLYSYATIQPHSLPQFYSPQQTPHPPYTASIIPQLHCICLLTRLRVDNRLVYLQELRIPTPLVYIGHLFWQQQASLRPSIAVSTVFKTKRRVGQESKRPWLPRPLLQAVCTLRQRHFTAPATMPTNHTHLVGPAE